MKRINIILVIFLLALHCLCAETTEIELSTIKKVIIGGSFVEKNSISTPIGVFKIIADVNYQEMVSKGFELPTLFDLKHLNTILLANGITKLSGAVSYLKENKNVGFLFSTNPSLVQISHDQKKILIVVKKHLKR